MHQEDDILEKPPLTDNNFGIIVISDFPQQVMPAIIIVSAENFEPRLVGTGFEVESIFGTR